MSVPIEVKALGKFLSTPGFIEDSINTFYIAILDLIWLELI